MVTERDLKPDEVYIVNRLHKLYAEHDDMEMALVRATRIKSLYPPVLTRMWAEHDQLERNIIGLEAELPLWAVKQLKEGEL